MAEKYAFRPLTADDLFPMCTIISKIGAQDFKKCLETPGVMEAVMGEGEVNLDKVGVAVMADFGVAVLSHMEECRNDIYRFLSSLSGIPIAEFPGMKPGRFACMVISIFRKDDFKDFFQEVSELFRQETSDSSTSSISDTQTL